MSGSKDNGVDDPISFFKNTSASAIARVLARADRNAAKEARRQHNMIRSIIRPPRSLLGKALGKALAHHGRASKGRASIRQTAPDTGGRPYHFGFSSVTKGESARGRRSGTGRPGGPGGANGSDDSGTAARGGTARKGRSAGPAAGVTINGKPRSREGAHQSYTERYAALEKNPIGIQQAIREAEEARQVAQERRGAETGREQEAPGRDNGQSPQGIETSRALTMIEPEDREQEDPELSAGPARQSRGIDPALSQEWVEREIGRGPGLSERHSEAAAQAYIENPEKSAQLRGTTSSFGTIGETFEERLEFWDLVHKHESKDGRTQSRLVVELPHEANAKARHEIVRRFTNDLLEKGIPFWASIHAPTKQNDYRNHHAHIVFIDRPASKMIHPDTGELAWDFTVEQVHRTRTSGNIRRTFPFRQNRDPDMRDRGYIKRSRARFSEITNQVMQEYGVGVRYDPRSYKDMGLNVAPMNHVSRILADKTKSQAFVVMDPEWTRKMINQEMKAAAIWRDETYQALRATEDKLQAVTRALQNTSGANKVLPKDMKLSPGHQLTRDVGNRLLRKWTEIERDRLAAKFVDEVTIRTLNHIVEATTPKTTSKGPAKVYSSEQAPDAEDLRHLNEAAKEELRAYKIQASSRSNWYANRRASVSEEWQAESEGTAHRSKAARTPPPAQEEKRHEGRGGAQGWASPPAQEAPPAREKAHSPAGADNQQRTKAAGTAHNLAGDATARNTATARRAAAPPTRKETTAEAEEIAEGLKRARRMAHERVQRMILTAGSPADFAALIEQQVKGNSAAAMYDAHMARLRANAREPMVTIMSQGTVQPIVDPVSETERRRQDAVAKSKRAPAPPVELPAPMPIRACAAIETVADASMPTRAAAPGQTPAAATSGAGAAAEAAILAVGQTRPLSSGAGTTVAEANSTRPAVNGNQTRPGHRNLPASEVDEQLHPFGVGLPASARRQRSGARNAADRTAVIMEMEGPALGRASSRSDTGQRAEAAPSREQIAKPTAAKTNDSVSTAQPELFPTDAAAVLPRETEATGAEPSLPKTFALPTPEEIDEEIERKKRRRALLAQKHRNRGGFEI